MTEQKNIAKLSSNQEHTNKGGYKTSRGDNKALMIEFRFKSGRSKAIGYAYISEMDLDPSDSIILNSTTSVITLKGRNLEPLFKHLLQHKVTFIEEMPDGEVSKEQTSIHAIEVQGK